MRFTRNYVYAGLTGLCYFAVKVTAEDCIIANAICRNTLGFDSYCRMDDYHCQGASGTNHTCACGTFLEVGTPAIDYDDYLVPGFPFVGNNYPNITIIGRPTIPLPITSTTTTTTTTPDPTSTETQTTYVTIVPGETTDTSTATSTTTTTTATSTSTTTTSTTTEGPPTYDGSSQYMWTEWPSMDGESDWITYYARLLSFLTTGKIKFNKVILRVLDPTFGSIADSRHGTTAHDLWSISLDSVLYRNFISLLPASITEVHVLPYLMETHSQDAWMTSMSCANPLESTFKYLNEWNKLLGYKRFTGIVVDGEERRGYLSEMDLVNDYKATYDIATFGYCTGYPQVGVFGVYGDVVDAFYMQMYDFYVRDSPTLVLVQNGDVADDDYKAFIVELDADVWSQYLPYYENAKVHFMWSVQDSVSADCYYPDGPSTCGIKEDFGANWSVNGYLNFLSKISQMYPTKFGNKPHGLFQFSFIPKSWYP